MPRRSSVSATAATVSVPEPRRADVEASIASDLVTRAQQGDKFAFNALVIRYRPRIFALALHITGRASEADDIAQDVFLRAFQALPNFAGKSEFFTWLYRIALNQCSTALKRNSKYVPTDDTRLELALDADAPEHPVRAMELRQTYRRLLAGLDRLTPELRTTVILVALQGLSHGEAAVVLECSEGTISWRIHEARRRLREALEKRAQANDRSEQEISHDLLTLRAVLAL